MRQTGIDSNTLVRLGQVHGYRSLICLGLDHILLVVTICIGSSFYLASSESDTHMGDRDLRLSAYWLFSSDRFSIESQLWAMRLRTTCFTGIAPSTTSSETFVVLYPIFASLTRYRSSHHAHHTHTNDPRRDPNHVAGGRGNVIFGQLPLTKAVFVYRYYLKGILPPVCALQSLLSHQDG